MVFKEATRAFCDTTSVIYSGGHRKQGRISRTESHPSSSTRATPTGVADMFSVEMIEESETLSELKH